MVGKKVTAMLLCSVLCLFNMTSVFAMENEGSVEIYEKYRNDIQFKMMQEEYGKDYADTFLSDVENMYIDIASMKNARGGGGNTCYQRVTNIQQTKSYNCGTTTVLQTLYGLGTQNKVAGKTNGDKIETLDKEYNVDSQGSLMVYQVRDALNKYSNKSYIYELGSSMTKTGFEDRIAASLTAGKPVVLHARTEKITYYKGHSSGHYISLDYVDRLHGVVRLVDCNNNSNYYGVHPNVAVSDAYNAIAASGRYLIY
ncbi:MAG: hypothetical protein MR954_00855 [Lachnobacterium sp.]|nr:hypothetical protein [Lachnobacterium sp.]